MSAVNRSSMLNIALDASARKKPIVLTTTTVVTTKKTTKHIRLGENGQEYEIGLNDLESFLDEEPKKKVVKKNIALTPKLTSNRRMNKGELRKRKTISQSAGAKAKAQHWTESDTEANTTDDDGERHGFISDSEKENGGILSSTMSTDVPPQNAGANEFDIGQSSLTLESASVEPIEGAEKMTKRRNKQNGHKVTDQKTKKAIDEIIEESLAMPIDMVRAEYDAALGPSSRKLSAIFETSAETSANQMNSSELPAAERSPIVERMASNHYRQAIPPNMSMEAISSHNIATDESTLPPTFVAARRATRIFDSKLVRANLHQDEIDEVDAVAAPRKRKTRKNVNKLSKLQPLVENAEVAISNTQQVTGTVPVASIKAADLEPKARRNTRNETKFHLQPLEENAESAVESNQDDVTPETVRAIRSKARRNTGKTVKSKSQSLEADVNLNDIETVAAALPSVGIPKPKARRNAKKMTRAESPPVEEDAVPNNQNDVETVAAASPPAGNSRPRKRNTKKSSKSGLQSNEENARIEVQNNQNDIPPESPSVENPKLKGRRNTRKTTKSKLQPCEENGDITTQNDHNGNVSTASNDLVPNEPLAEAHQSKSRRNTNKRAVNMAASTIQPNEAQQNKQKICSTEVTSPAKSLKRKKRYNDTTTNKPDYVAPEENEEKSNKIARKGRAKEVSKHVDDTPTELAEEAQTDANDSPKSNTKRPVSEEPAPQIAIATNTVDASSSASRSHKPQKPKKLTKISSSSTELVPNTIQPQILPKNKPKPPKGTVNKPIREQKLQPHPELLSESILFGEAAHVADASQVHTEADQSHHSSTTEWMKSTNGKSKQLIIYSPSRDKALVNHIDGKRVIIPKSMIAKAIGNLNSGVLSSMRDDGMIINANERLLYSPRMGDNINVQKEVKKGTDILAVLAKRRKSLFILQSKSSA